MSESRNELKSKTVLPGRSPCGSYKYEKYRIPGMIAAKSGVILAYFEARMSGSDWADMDIILLRSEDGGETFSEPFVLAEGSETCRTVNNPVMIQGADGVIHFLYCVEYGVTSIGGDALYRQSRDDGRTWSEPVSIIDSTMPEYHNAFAFGPGHGICQDDGTLLVPVWLVPKSAGSEPKSHHPAEVRVFYSRDNGRSFCLSERVPQGEITDPNETTAVGLPDGGVMLNIRHMPGYRAVSFSKNGIDGWTTMQRTSRLPTPAASAVRQESRRMTGGGLYCSSTARTSTSGGI